MSARGKRGVGTVETEIERAREDGNWKRVIELAEQLRARPDKQFETLGCFLIGEGKLEDFLEEHPPKDTNFAKAKLGLAEAKHFLSKTIGDEAKKLGVHLDSYILLGKLHFAMGMYSDSLKFYERAQLDTLEEKHLPPRSLKIMAEAFAIKGLCYEKLPEHSTSRQRRSERRNAIIKCYELASDLTLLFLQTADKATTGLAQSTWSVTSAGTTGTGSSSPVPPLNAHQKLGNILETALLKAPQLEMKSGRHHQAIQRYRAMLTAEESESTTGVRRNVCRQLAEALIHGISDFQYVAPDAESPRRTPSRQSNESPWKPRKHAGGSTAFAPQSKQEEIILLLLLSENMASKEAVLSQSPEYAESRKRTYEQATAVYDLMAIVLSRYNNFRLLCQMLEHSLKFSFREPHSWRQFAYTLINDGQYVRALQVFRQVHTQHLGDVASMLVAARLCYDKLHLYEEGLLWAERAMELEQKEQKQDATEVARCSLFIGIGHLLMRTLAENRTEQKLRMEKSEAFFKQAGKLDPDDHLCEYYLGLQYAYIRKIPSASNHIKRALNLYYNHLHSLQLFVLILTAANEYDEALNLVDQALAEYPDNIHILLLKVKVQEVAEGGEAAMRTAKEMLRYWQYMSDFYATTSGDSGIGPDEIRHQGLPYGFDALSDKDSISLHAHSVTASHVEKTLSEVASSMSSQFNKMDPIHDASYTLFRIWLITAELHLNMGNIDQAEMCVYEARQLSPLNHHLMHTKGLVQLKRGNFEDARLSFENSLAINPTFVPSLYHLGIVYHALGCNRLAEQCLKLAVRVDPLSEDAWSLLGQIDESLGNEAMDQQRISHEEYVEEKKSATPTVYRDESEKTPTEETVVVYWSEATKFYKRASECHSIALSVQATAPIAPFHSLPLCFE